MFTNINTKEGKTQTWQHVDCGHNQVLQDPSQIRDDSPTGTEDKNQDFLLDNKRSFYTIENNIRAVKSTRSTKL